MKIITLVEDTCGNPECQCEHGLSIYVETKKHKLLVDAGKTDAFLKNAEKLGIDLCQVDTAILSHGHYDHAGGLMAFHEANPHAAIYMQRSASGDFYHGERYIGMDKRIAALPQAVLLDGDCRIDEELFLFAGITGRRLFSRGNRMLSERKGGALRQDSFSHEQCLVITQDGRNTLFSGCAHNGILNILDRYRELFGDAPQAVVSGFHMMKKGDYTSEEEEEIRATARELAAMDTVFWSGHCTGEKALRLMAPIMGEKLGELHTGEALA